MLIGEKLHKALYPKRLALLAAALGINVNTASTNSTPMNIMWMDIFLSVTFFSYQNLLMEFTDCSDGALCWDDSVLFFHKLCNLSLFPVCTEQTDKPKDRKRVHNNGNAPSQEWPIEPKTGRCCSDID